MSSARTMRKITISIPDELVEYTDERARVQSVSRSQVISMALSETKMREEQKLAAEGYQFYADESSEFAQASGDAVSEAWAEPETFDDAEGATDDR